MVYLIYTYTLWHVALRLLVYISGRSLVPVLQLCIIWNMVQLPIETQLIIFVSFNPQCNIDDRLSARIAILNSLPTHVDSWLTDMYALFLLPVAFMLMYTYQ